MANRQKAPVGATLSDDGQLIRCITARQVESRNVGQPWWVTFGEYEAELGKGREARFFLARKNVPDADDLGKIHGLTEFDVQQLHIRGIFHFGQLLRPGKDRLTDVALRSFFQVDRDLEGLRLKAIRGFREAAAQGGTDEALKRMVAKSKAAELLARAKPAAKAPNKKASAKKPANGRKKK